MNNKGFTLVEMLAVVVILSVIMGIATVNVVSTMNKSREKSEGVFVDKLATAIETYINYKGSSMSSTGDSYSFVKCKRSSGSNCTGADRIETSAQFLGNFGLDRVTENDVLKKSDLVNPSNKKNCLTGTIPKVDVYKDSEFVYYYYVDVSSASCNISSKNSIITNIPESLCSVLKARGRSSKCDQK